VTCAKLNRMQIAVLVVLGLALAMVDSAFGSSSRFGDSAADLSDIAPMDAQDADFVFQDGIQADTLTGTNVANNVAQKKRNAKMQKRALKAKKQSKRGTLPSGPIDADSADMIFQNAGDDAMTGASITNNVKRNAKIRRAITVLKRMLTPGKTATSSDSVSDVSPISSSVVAAATSSVSAPAATSGLMADDADFIFQDGTTAALTGTNINNNVKRALQILRRAGYRVRN